MSKRAFEKIAAGLDEALAVAQGNLGEAKMHVPAEIDVKAIRRKAGLSQDGFASAYGFSVHQLRQWEQGRNRPLDAMRAYLLLIAADPFNVLEKLRAATDPARPGTADRDSPRPQRTRSGRAGGRSAPVLSR